MLNYATDQNERKRAMAPSALVQGCYDDPQTVSVLRKQAVDDKSPLVRSAAVSALARLQSDSLMAFVLDRATSDPDAKVRLASLSGAVDHLRDNSQLLQLLFDRIRKDKHEDVRSFAVWVLALLFNKNAQTSSFIYDFASKDNNEDVRSSVIETLWRYWPNDSRTLTLLHKYAEKDSALWLRERSKELAAKIESQNKE
jgi:HEAT repeat protein